MPESGEIKRALVRKLGSLGVFVFQRVFLALLAPCLGIQLIYKRYTHSCIKIKVDVTRGVQNDSQNTDSQIHKTQTRMQHLRERGRGAASESVCKDNT